MCTNFINFDAKFEICVFWMKGGDICRCHEDDVDDEVDMVVIDFAKQKYKVDKSSNEIENFDENGQICTQNAFSNHIG